MKPGVILLGMAQPPPLAACPAGLGEGAPPLGVDGDDGGCVPSLGWSPGLHCSSSRGIPQDFAPPSLPAQKVIISETAGTTTALPARETSHDYYCAVLQSFILTKSSKSSTYHTLTAHLSLDLAHFKRPAGPV